MNWGAVGAIGEIVGAAAVVVSVVYLAARVRKQTHEARLGATRDLAGQFHETLGSLAEDETFMSIYLRGIRDYRALPDAERLRLSFYLIRILGPVWIQVF